MDMPSFLLPANGKATPKSLDRKRKMADALLQSGMDTSPIASPWQGFARMAQALAGGLATRKADQQEAEGQQSARDAMTKALMGGDKGAMLDAMNNPFMDSTSLDLVGDAWKEANKPAEPDKLIPVDGRLYNQTQGAWIDPPQGGASGNLFGGKSVEAEALNHLINTGALTQDQAAQIAAGKPITGADGSVHFLTPADIVAAAQQQATPGGQAPQAGIPLGPSKKPESQIKGEARESGIASSIAALTNGGTPDNPMPIFDALDQTQNRIGNAMPEWAGGNFLVSPEGQVAVDATRNIIQNYIYTLSGAQAPDTEVNRQMDMVIPKVGDKPDRIRAKKARLMDMIRTVQAGAQGPGGNGQKLDIPQSPPPAPKRLKFNPATGELE